MKALWTRRSFTARLLTPVACLFRLVVHIRSTLYKKGYLNTARSSVPVVVVGNISVGGTGKTPIVAALVKKLQSAGERPGIVSRGYGAVQAKEPRAIDAETAVEWAGDEPAMLFRETGVPVCICTDRSAAVEYLANETNTTIVISDDGLQHYAMHRDIELAVIDGQRLLGNGWLLPAGPLREPAARLNSVDVIAVQQTPDIDQADKANIFAELGLKKNSPVAIGSFHLDIISLVNLHSNEQSSLSLFAHQPVHAIAGVGNPERFFHSLRQANLIVKEHSMPDHHNYAAVDVQFNDDLPVMMTSKDAVKIRELNIDLTNFYEVSVTAVLDENLNDAIDHALRILQT